MGLGFDDAGGDEAIELGGGVLDALDFESDAGEGLDDFRQRGVGVEMVLQPGESEFQASAPFSVSSGAANSGKRAGRNGG